jgi:hypothetical protein
MASPAAVIVRSPPATEIQPLAASSSLSEVIPSPPAVIVIVPPSTVMVPPVMTRPSLLAMPSL